MHLHPQSHTTSGSCAAMAVQLAAALDARRAEHGQSHARASAGAAAEASRQRSLNRLTACARNVQAYGLRCHGHAVHAVFERASRGSRDGAPRDTRPRYQQAASSSRLLRAPAPPGVGHARRPYKNQPGRKFSLSFPSPVGVGRRRKNRAARRKRLEESYPYCFGPCPR